MPRSKEDQILYKRFRDLGNMAYQRGICVYSDFVTITQQELACQALAELYPNIMAVVPYVYPDIILPMPDRLTPAV